MGSFAREMALAVAHVLHPRLCVWACILSVRFSNFVASHLSRFHYRSTMLSALTGVSIPMPHSYSDLRLAATEFESLGFFDMEDLIGADPSFVDGITAFDSRVKILAKRIIERASAVGAQASSGPCVCVCDFRVSRFFTQGKR